MKTIFRSACKSHFVQLPNQMLRDNSISLRARGLLAMVLTYQEDWVITKAWIEEKVPEGKQAVSSTFRELEAAGYAVMTEQREVETGKISSKTWTFHDSPVPEGERSTATSRPGDRNPDCGNPPSGNPECGNPESGLSATTNTMGNEHHHKEPKFCTVRNSMEADEIHKASGIDGVQPLDAKAQIALEHLNRASGKAFRSTPINLKLIRARLESVGGDLDGVIQMINRQVALWGNDPKLFEYLRPSTLFRPSNFDGYYDSRSMPVLGCAPRPKNQMESRSDMDRMLREAL